MIRTRLVQNVEWREDVQWTESLLCWSDHFSWSDIDAWPHHSPPSVPLPPPSPVVVQAKHCHRRFCAKAELEYTTGGSSKQAGRQTGGGKKSSILLIYASPWSSKDVNRITFSSFILWKMQCLRPACRCALYQAARVAESAFKIIRTQLSAASIALKLTGQIKGLVYIIFISITYESFKWLFSVFYLFIYFLQRPSQYIPALYAHIMNSAPSLFFHDWILIFALVVGLRIRSRQCCVYSLQALYMKVKKMGGGRKNKKTKQR